MRKKLIVAVLCAVVSFSASAQKKNIKTETFKVLGTCEQCKNRIEKTLRGFGTSKGKLDSRNQYTQCKLRQHKI